MKKIYFFGVIFAQLAISTARADWSGHWSGETKIQSEFGDNQVHDCPEDRSYTFEETATQLTITRSSYSCPYAANTLDDVIKFRIDNGSLYLGERWVGRMSPMVIEYSYPDTIDDNSDHTLDFSICTGHFERNEDAVSAIDTEIYLWEEGDHTFTPMSTVLRTESAHVQPISGSPR